MCQTVFESSCATMYVELRPGKFEANTECEKLPVQVCGPGCTFQEGADKCHEEVITSFVEIPEEVCDLNPQKTCRFTTKLVPKLEQLQECTVITRETCHFLKTKTFKESINNEMVFGL